MYIYKYYKYTFCHLKTASLCIISTIRDMKCHEEDFVSIIDREAAMLLSTVKMYKDGPI
jgi:hypothetical protein